MKVFASLALSCALFLGARAAAVEAIGSYSLGGYSVLYSPGGAGFGFSPQARIAVTALGHNAVALESAPYQVTLWNSQGGQLATALVTASSPLLNQTRYETIPSVVLNPGQTYYLGAVGTNGYWIGYEIHRSSLPPGSFEVAPSLTYVGQAIGTNDSGVFPAQVGSSDNLYLGANFQFNTGPFILLTSIRVQTNQARIDFTVEGGAPTSFTLLQAASLKSAWNPNPAAVLTTNVPGSAYTFTVPVSGPIQFYRVRSP